jgi:amino acid adenylation domain-containing protein
MRIGPVSTDVDAPGPPARPVDASDEVFVLPASSAQARLWFIDELRPGHPVYNIPASFDLAGPLDVQALAQSVRHLVQRHEALRTTFMQTGGELRQMIAVTADLPVEVIDLADVPHASRSQKQVDATFEFARGGFDLARGPLARVALLRWTETEHTLLINVHHTIADGWSIGILCAELSQLYADYAAGRTPALPPLDLQYADYAVWQRERLDVGQAQAHAEYWRRALDGAPPVLELPADRPRPPVKSFEGAVERLDLSASQRSTLQAFAREQQVTPFLVLLATAAVVLSRCSRQDDVLLGTPIADRGRSETESLVGFLINTVVLRADVSGNPTVRELLGRLRAVTAAASAHHELPFDQLVGILQPERDLSMTPIFQVMVAFQPDPLERLALPGLSVTPVPVHNGTAKFDLFFGFEETAQGMRGMLEYSTDLFDAATIRRMAGHFLTLLDALVADPNRPISELAMLTEPERRQVLLDWNATGKDYPSDECLHELFERQAAQTPDATAVISGADRVTYRELNQRADRLSTYLRFLGVTRGALVGVCLDRSPDLVVALLAILKSGAAYVPLDPAYPHDRLEFILEDAAVTVVLTSEKVRSVLPSHAAREVVVAESDTADVPRMAAMNVSQKPRADDVAYVIYTSGSTGRPKGVQLEHRVAVTMMYWARDTYTDQELAGVLASTSICFDLSVFEIFAPLSWGGKVILSENALQLPALTAARDVTLINTVPSVMNELLRVEGLPASLRVANVAGEPLKPALVDEIYKSSSIVKVFDVYGPSETSYTTCALRGPGAVETIGRPVANVQTYVLDRDRRPVPIGVPGELYIGGATLARGYLNRPELTDARFIPNPFGPQGSRLYRSGDLTRWLPDGNLQFLGRTDHQVKLRGFRIELGEIASVLRQHSRVAESVVVVREDLPGDKRLVAYLVAVRGGAEPVDQAQVTSEVRAWLKSQLPDYMVPSALVWLTELPLTPNGKIDRGALPAPEWSSPSAQPVAPTTDTERRLVDIWMTVLGLDQPIGVDDNFFNLGGHSLLAVQLFQRIQQVFGRNFPLATLFQGPTIRQLAAIVDAHRETADFSTLVAIQPNGHRPPFFAVHGVGGNVLNYRALARYVGDDQPFYGLQARGLDGKSLPHTRVEDMAAEYLPEIRRVQPSGPYYIGGFSFGCSVAFEIAQRLRRAGEEVALLALIDGGLWRAEELLPLRVRIPRIVLFQLSRLRMHAADVLRLRPSEILAFFRRKKRTLLHRARGIVWRSRYRQYQETGAELPEHLRRVDEGAYMAFRNYRPTYYDGRAVLFRSGSGWRLRPVVPHGGWGVVAQGGLEVRRVPGDHVTVTMEPHVQVLAKELRRALESAQQRAGATRVRNRSAARP